ncbi:MAG: 4Fe-4S binding protein [Bacteroidales bacterium]|nr:4Fe-4S binding protein [Bacteroidales bacterium]
MIIHNKLLVYYFSGTGNSRNVAIWLSDIAREKGMEIRVLNLAEIDRINVEKPDPDALIAFISPVHGFNYPPVMLYFIMRFPKGRNKILLMNTRAGMLINKWITPGLSGIAFYFSALLLRLKGYSIQAMYPVDLPSNWISVHPGLNQPTIEFLHTKMKEKIKKFAEKVFAGKKDFGSLKEIIQDMAISPIALAYFFIGRFVFAKTYFASKDCNNCNLCVKACPVKAIKIINNRPFWTFNCESCMKCMSHCPKNAIETAHGFIIAFSLFTSTFVYSLFYVIFEKFFNPIESGFLQFLVESLIFLGLLAVFHRILHFLLRFKAIERTIVYTSLTKYKFWGRRYKALKP